MTQSCLMVSRPRCAQLRTWNNQACRHGPRANKKKTMLEKCRDTCLHNNVRLYTDMVQACELLTALVLFSLNPGHLFAIGLLLD